MRLRTDDLTWRAIDGDLVVLDLRSSTYLTANGSATVLLQLLTEDRTPPQLVDALLDAYDVTEQQARRDVVTFLDELDQRGLLLRGAVEPSDPVAAPGGR